MQRRVVVGIVAVVTLLVAACGGGGSKSSSSTATGGGSSAAGSSSGGSSGSASSNMAKALDSVAGNGGTITLSLFGSVADFDALSTTPSTQKADAIANKLIPDSSVAISFSGSKFDLDLKLGGEDKAVDVLATGGTLYLKVDVKGIGASTGADTSKLTSQAGALSAELPFINAILAGNYVSLDLKQLSGLAKLAEGAAGGSGALGQTPTTLSASTEKQILNALTSALSSGTQITKVGSDSVGDHYQIAVMPKDLAQSFYSTAASLAGPLSSQLGKAQADLSKIPNTPVTVDAWLGGGKLKQIELDLRQFHKGSGGPTNPVGLKVEFSTSAGSFSAPSGATPVDLTKLGALLGGALGGAAGASGAS